jgi:segregation and condensation protein B
LEEKLSSIVEALLFASDGPLSIQKLKDLLGISNISELKKALQKLTDFYMKSSSALKIVEIAGGYQIVTKEEYSKYIHKLYRGRNISRLTQQALETLSIVAYKQPITKQEIESVRGVNVDAVMRTLLERNLITIEGRQKAPGNPLLYGTTKFFLQYFGLKSLEALPRLKEIDELLKEDQDFLESLDQVVLEQLTAEKLGLKGTPEKNLKQESAKEDSSNKINKKQ